MDWLDDRDGEDPATTAASMIWLLERVFLWAPWIVFLLLFMLAIWGSPPEDPS